MSEVYYSLEIKRERGDGLRGKIKEFELGLLSITTFDSDEQRVLRTRERIAHDPDDSFVFVMPMRQHLYYSQAGRSGVVRPGGYVVVSTSEFYELSCPDGFLNWTVKIPGRELRNRVPTIDDHCACRFPNNAKMARVAQKLISNVATTFAADPPPRQSGLSKNLVDFVALVIQGENVDGECVERLSRYQLRRRIFAHIQQNLRDPELTPKMIAEACGISVSYLYKLFNETGVTVGQYIQGQRLQWAYEQLASASEGQSTVGEIAYAAGFRNISHFSRAFSQTFEMAPRDVRRMSFTRQ